MPARAQPVVRVGSKVDSAGQKTKTRKVVAEPPAAGTEVKDLRSGTKVGCDVPVKRSDRATPNPPLPGHRVLRIALRKLLVVRSGLGPSAFSEANAGVLFEEAREVVPSVRQQEALDAVNGLI